METCRQKNHRKPLNGAFLSLYPLRNVVLLLQGGGEGGNDYLCPRIKPTLHYAGLAMSNSATQSSAGARVHNSMYLLPPLEERES